VISPSQYSLLVVDGVPPPIVSLTSAIVLRSPPSGTAS